MNIDPTQDQLDELANLYHSGQMTQVVNICQELIKDYKTSLVLFNILGSALQETGKLKEAIDTYQHVIQIYPDYIDAHYNLGNALKELGHINKAIVSYQQVIKLDPNYTEAYNNLGVSFQELGQLKESVDHLKKAIQLDPNYTEAYHNLGVSFQELGQLEESINSFNKAIQLDPNYNEAHNSLGFSLYQKGQAFQAIEQYQKAIELDPNSSGSYNNIGLVLQDLSKIDKAINYYNKALEIRPDATSIRQNLLIAFSYDVHANIMHSIKKAREFGAFITQKITKHYSHDDHASSPKKLRIGFVSGDLLNHPVGYFLEDVVSNIDPNNIELVAYPTKNITDDLSERIKPFFTKWTSIFGQSNKTAAQTIHNDQINILLDLSGHTAHNRLPIFAYKPAPIQVSWLGYWATTGISEIDYFLGDPHVTPAKYDRDFVEQVWRLPDTRLCFTPPNFDIKVGPLPALKNNHITFGCFNNLSKINNQVIELWSEILKSIPSSRLLLKTKLFSDKSVCENTIQKFVEKGVNANNIILEGPETREDYFLAYNKIDIALDPFPFTGGTISAECLWMGVPILTLAGDHLVARQGVGILMNVGLPEWIADDKKEYISKSIKFSSDLDTLSELRQRLREQALSSPLFNAVRFAKNFEAALWSMWDKHLKK